MKYALSYITIIAAILGFLNVFPVMRLRDILLEGKYTSLQNQAALIASSLSPLTALNPEEVGRVMALLDYPDTTHIIITDPNGVIVYNSDSGGGSAPPDLLKALDSKFVFRSKYADGGLDSAASQPIVYRNDIIGALYLRQSNDSEASVIPTLQSDLKLLTLAILLGTLFLAILFARIFTKRIISILRAIKAVHGGAFDYRLPVKGRDEISELGWEFNRLAERLQRTEEMRARFVSDASHELKTPLAGIRLLTDSIVQNEDMNSETIREFVGDIGSEADRLTRVTERLLELTRLSNSSEVRSVPINFKKVISDALKLLTPLAEEKDITIYSTLSDVCVILADADDVYQAVFNLIENAIKYNVENGSVTLLLFPKDGNAHFIADDTGVGIPENELPQIFERFYRVDKARARAAGGSGLGLSIVKDVAEKHNGNVTVERGAISGTRFILTFPLYDVDIDILIDTEIEEDE